MEASGVAMVRGWRMRRFRFAFVSNSEEVGEAVRAYSDPAIEQVTLNLATMERAVPVAQTLLADGVEVIIGGGGTGSLLAETIGQPVVKLDRSPLDFLRALTEAKRFGAKIAVTNFAKPVEGCDLFEEILSVHLRQIIFSKSDELEIGVRNAVREGCQVVVGGGICRDVANRLGVSSVLIVPPQESVLQTLQEARAVALARRTERRNLEELTAILHTVREGIVAIDNRGRVKIFNDAAAEIFRSILSRASGAGLVGKRLPAVLEPMGLGRTLNTGIAETDQVRRIGNIDVVVSSLPIFVDGEAVGAISTIRETSRIHGLDRKVREKLYKKGFVAKHTLEQTVEGSPSLKPLLEKARRYAEAEAAILIEGETGTGKELLAQGVHNASKRQGQPFLGINCSALSESLLESELFGYEEGAFTGARRGGKVGLFELANKGTLFLDEIADISPNLQVRLLRAIEEGEIMRLGGDRIVRVDVRVVSSSQRNLFQATQDRAFRADLYFRLATLRLTLPPLRERTEDFSSLLRVLFAKHGRELRAAPTRLTKFLTQYDWPGNVRELDSLVRTYLALSDEHGAFNEQLFLQVFGELCLARKIESSTLREGDPPPDSMGPLKEQLRHFEAKLIHRVLEECRYNRTHAARKLGISVNSLWRKSRLQLN
jgi:transcriptional regulator, propionate catabolism operon regulatory protein